ncbi:PP2C family protein-serine/threonine phosphatase [Streptomyces sp. SCSIO 30461]|uniref:PP2C family protein-serine/threonine phosphatase n=1 Tax=Streptomyces sp. SCSIO 30461 TaxID=3118085 RepID=UPI0030CDF9CA
MNRVLCGERFVTAVIAEIREDRTVALLNYGHPSPPMIHSDGTARFLAPKTRAMPLGLGMRGAQSPETLSTAFHPGDLLLLDTDGVSEARGGRGEFHPPGSRLRLLNADSPELALDALHSDIVAYVGGPLGDGAAMLLLHYRA